MRRCLQVVDIVGVIEVIVFKVTLTFGVPSVVGCFADTGFCCQVELGRSPAHTCSCGPGLQKEGIKDYLSGIFAPSQVGLLPPPQPFFTFVWFAAPVTTHHTIFYSHC